MAQVQEIEVPTDERYAVAALAESIAEIRQFSEWNNHGHRCCPAPWLDWGYPKANTFLSDRGGVINLIQCEYKPNIPCDDRSWQIRPVAAASPKVPFVLLDMLRSGECLQAPE